jgi:penicillin-binding protein 2
MSDEEIATVAINRYRLPGVEVEAQLVRHYPMGELFVHALGYVGRINEHELQALDPKDYAGTHHIGKLGIEREYEDILHGSVGYENVETNARGRVLRVLDSTPPVPGSDLHLHLDAYVQQVAFDALQGERGAIVAIDPATGGVIAFVSTPAYDPNLFIRGISHADYAALRDSVDRPLFNRALQGQYPPGSTVKPIFALAGLEYGVMTPNTMVPDPGWYQLPNDERQYRDWKKGGHGALVGLFQAIAESCDVYFYELANRLGVDRLHAFSSHFGLGERTGIDLPNESRGLMPSREWKRQSQRRPWYPGETLSLGIGQGYMLATPLQLADAAAVLATRGKRMQPHLVARIGDEAVEPKWVDGVSLRKPEYWDLVQSAMEGVVHSLRGTAKGISKGMDYRIAGKTGTAQVVTIQRNARGDAIDEEEKRRRDHALFIAYAPADNPRLAIGIIVENGEHGSSTAAPIARKVFDAYFQGEPMQTAKPMTEGISE